MTKATTKTSIKIGVIGLLVALTFIVAASTLAATITEVQAKKGEAAQHISTQGAANQSPKGAANSGGCQVLC